MPWALLVLWPSVGSAENERLRLSSQSVKYKKEKAANQSAAFLFAPTANALGISMSLVNYP